MNAVIDDDAPQKAGAKASLYTWIKWLVAGTVFIVGILETPLTGKLEGI